MNKLGIFVSVHGNSIKLKEKQYNDVLSVGTWP